ncbi:hypothetical protein ACFLSF_01535 [Candidatus Bipolaricaulota bacterium]
MTHPVKVSADLFARLREEADRDKLTLQAVLQRQLDRGAERVRDLAESRVNLETQVEALRARLGSAGRESAREKERLTRLEREEARLASELRKAVNERVKLADALSEAELEAATLSTDLAETKEKAAKQRKMVLTLTAAVAISGLLVVAYSFLKRAVREKKPVTEEESLPPPVFLYQGF